MAGHREGYMYMYMCERRGIRERERGLEVDWVCHTGERDRERERAMMIIIGKMGEAMQNEFFLHNQQPKPSLLLCLENITIIIMIIANSIQLQQLFRWQWPNRAM